MTWSLANLLAADAVTALLDSHDTYKDADPPVARAMSREVAESVIHAALWAYGVRSDSTAGAYAWMNLWSALNVNLQTLTFRKEGEDVWGRSEATITDGDAVPGAPATEGMIP